MERVALCMLILVVTLQYTTAGGVASPTAIDFIRASCKTTLHASGPISLKLRRFNPGERPPPGQSLNNTQSASVFISKLGRVSGIKHREYQAVKDCISTMKNSVTSLSQSIQEPEQMARTTGQDFEWHMSNAETWIGSALTNQNVCARGFTESYMSGHVKDAVTSRMVYVSEVTSNA